MAQAVNAGLTTLYWQIGARIRRDVLEYLIVHELVHLVERRHNDFFTQMMGKHLPLLASASAGAEFFAARSRELELLSAAGRGAQKDRAT